MSEESLIQHDVKNKQLKDENKKLMRMRMQMRMRMKIKIKN